MPSRVFTNPAAERIVNVVPREVADNAAPAAKHCRGVAEVSRARRKDSAMGRRMPVIATRVERGRFRRSGGREVFKPP